MTPFEQLGLPPDATLADVKGRWRELASQHHPDHGGDGATFARYRDAYRRALAELERPKPCAQCHGRKTVIIQRGLSQLAVRCGHCQGTGKEPT